MVRGPGDQLVDAGSVHVPGREQPHEAPAAHVFGDFAAFNLALSGRQGSADVLAYYPAEGDPVGFDCETMGLVNLSSAGLPGAYRTGFGGAAARDRARLPSEVERHLRLNDNRQKRIDQFLVEIHKKFSIPVACMVFVLLGAPLGAVIRRRGVAVSAAVSLAFFWVYWVFLIGGEELADRGYVGPALAMWAPNLVFGLLGLLLTHRTAHDRPWLARARPRRNR